MYFQKNRNPLELREESELPWDERYFKETDPVVRRKILDDEFEKGNNEEALVMADKLFKARYFEDAKLIYGDSFAGVLVSLKLLNMELGNFFGAKKRRNEALALSEKLCLSRLSEFSEDILYKEMCQLAAFFVVTATGDRTYCSFIFGLGRVNDVNLKTRILNDLKNMSVTVPVTLGLENEYSIMTRAFMDVSNML